MYGDCRTAGSVLVRIRPSRQVAVGPVIFVGPVSAAAVVLLIGRRAVFFVGAGLYVAAVVFRHLRRGEISPVSSSVVMHPGAEQVPD